MNEWILSSPLRLRRGEGGGWEDTSRNRIRNQQSLELKTRTFNWLAKPHAIQNVGIGLSSSITH